MSEHISPNLGLDLVRTTEAAALGAGRWMGRGNHEIATRQAATAMIKELNSLDIDGYIVIGEEGRIGSTSILKSGARVGTGKGPPMDVVVDPIDGTEFLIKGRAGAISVAAVAPRHAMWSPAPAVYMEKIVVGAEAAEALVPECIDAPAAWTLGLVARVLDKPVRDLVVFMLDRPRHANLLSEIQSTGARVMVRDQGDIAGALMVLKKDINVDILMGVGGIAEGILAACAVRTLGGAMLGRLAPQSAEERAAIKNARIDATCILSNDKLVSSGNNIYFSATGITDGVLFSGVCYRGELATTESLVVRGDTGTRRVIFTEHLLRGRS